jgi:hypothetical protein
MSEREAVRQAWIEANLYTSHEPKLEMFLRHFDTNHIDCWTELMQMVHTHYPEYKERLFTPIWNTGDKLLRLNLIRLITPDHEDEVDIFQRIIQRPDLRGDPWELEALLRVARRQGILRVASASA